MKFKSQKRDDRKSARRIRASEGKSAQNGPINHKMFEMNTLCKRGRQFSAPILYTRGLFRNCKSSHPPLIMERKVLFKSRSRRFMVQLFCWQFIQLKIY